MSVDLYRGQPAEVISHTASAVVQALQDDGTLSIEEDEPGEACEYKRIRKVAEAAIRAELGEPTTQADMFTTQHKTLTEARAELREGLRDGVICGCCDQLAKLYRRQINGAMAWLLIWLARNQTPGTWTPIAEFPLIQERRGGGDFAKLEYWGLLEERAPDEGTRARTSGKWRITSRGRAFAAGRLELPRYALVYNGSCLGFEGAPRGVRECLGTRFDFEELWGWTGERS